MAQDRDLIIKALECCIKAVSLYDCEKMGCPALTKSGCQFYLRTDEEGNDTIYVELIKDALSLIKELTEENERLRAENKIEYETPCGKQTMPNLLSLEGKTAELYRLIESKIKTDTVRKMQERLGKHFCHDPAFLGVEQRLIMDVIDQIAKEMLENADDK